MTYFYAFFILAPTIMLTGTQTLFGDIISAVELQQIASTTTRYTDTSSDGVSGWEFVAAESFTISALGYYDHPQIGFVDFHDVGLWQLSGANASLIAAARVEAGDTATLVGSFRYAAIEPLEITAGGTYVLGAIIGRGNGNSEFDPLAIPTASGWTHASQITQVAGRFGTINLPGGGFTDSNFPSDYGALSDPPILGPNFMLISAVPEPSSIFLLGSGIAAYFGWRRKKSPDLTGC